jgi:hypothetical protein
MKYKVQKLPENTPEWFTPGIVCWVRAVDNEPWEGPFLLTWFDGEDFLDINKIFWPYAEPVEEPQERPMTRDEAQALILWTPGLVVREKGEREWFPPWDFGDNYKGYQWTIQAPDGTYGKPHALGRAVLLSPPRHSRRTGGGVVRKQCVWRLKRRWWVPWSKALWWRMDCCGGMWRELGAYPIEEHMEKCPYCSRPIDRRVEL